MMWFILIFAGIDEPKKQIFLEQPLSDQPVRDGHDVSAIWKGEPGAVSPYEAFYYYLVDELQAVRVGDWKLRYALKEGRKSDPSRPQLFNLAEDP